MNSSTKHDAALCQKIGGSKIFKRRNFRGNIYSKCDKSAASSNGSSTTTSTLKSTSAKKITTKNNVYSNITAANTESDNEELRYFLIIISFDQPIFLLTVIYWNLQ